MGKAHLLLQCSVSQGGIFFKANSLSYNPQRVKVPQDYRGSDMLVLEGEKKQTETKNGDDVQFA